MSSSDDVALRNPARLRRCWLRISSAGQTFTPVRYARRQSSLRRSCTSALPGPLCPWNFRDTIAISPVPQPASLSEVAASLSAVAAVSGYAGFSASFPDHGLRKFLFGA